jgi:hypothetical protein
MGGTLNFLFEYNDYIDNINNLSDSDDFSIYKKFEKQRLIEGLIHTYSINKSIDIIKRRFPYLKCDLEEDGEIYIEGKFNDIKNYNPLFNNLGYFISKLTFNGSDWTNNYSDESKPIALFLEPKYDVKIEPLPNILYHASIKKFDKRIEKIGLIPKSGNKLSNYTDRIYLTDKLEIAKLFALNLKKEYNTDYSIYKINTNELNINLYEDINLKNGGYYTLSNIPPKYIEKII